MGEASSISSVVAVSDRRLRTLVGYNLKRAFNTVQADLNETLDAFDLRILTFSSLLLIRDNPGLRPSQLAEALSIERANLVSIVDQLARKGWVERRPNPDDRRTHALFVTDAGACHCERAVEAVDRHDARMHACLSPSERRILMDLLSRIETGEEKGR